MTKRALRKYTNIGKNTTQDEFKEQFNKGSVWSLTNAEQNQAMISGAVEAFNEERPQNLQTYLSLYDLQPGDKKIVSLLIDLTQGQPDKASVIDKALDKIASKKWTLNTILSSYLGTAEFAKKGLDVTFVDALLKCGAKANAEMLANAICRNNAAIVKTLHEHGAGFKDAGQYLTDSALLETLKIFQEHFTTEQELREDIAQLTKQLEKKTKPQVGNGLLLVKPKYR